MERFHFLKWLHSIVFGEPIVPRAKMSATQLQRDVESMKAAGRNMAIFDYKDGQLIPRSGARKLFGRSMSDTITQTDTLKVETDPSYVNELIKHAKGES